MQIATETLEAIDAVNIVMDALQEAHTTYLRLGTAGQRSVKKNTHGEMALQADIACEEAILHYLARIGLLIEVTSEEHGVMNVGGNAPLYTGVLDGIDGSYEYKKSMTTGKHGTMFAIFSGPDPTYDDYLACGILQHAYKKLYVAGKGCGATMMELGVPESHQTLRTSGETKLLAGITRLYIDECWPFNVEYYSKKVQDFELEGREFCMKCSTIYFTETALGQNDLILDCTHKGNLEMAVSYGLIKEAGGVMVDGEGNSIGPRHYLTFGQGKDERLPVITAATQDLAKKIIEYLKKSEEW